MTWSNPDKKWDGFRLTEYFFDLKKVSALQLTEKRTDDGLQKTLQLLLVRFIRDFPGGSMKSILGFWESASQPTLRSWSLRARPSNCDMLNTLLTLRQQRCLNNGFDPDVFRTNNAIGEITSNAALV
jgi:hypothetical protein